MPYRGECSPTKDGVCDVGEGLSTGILVVVPSALSPDPQTPDSAHVTLVCPVLSLLEPRVSGCEQDFVR